MAQADDVLTKLIFPYYAHFQARIVAPLPSIAWNQIALTGYIDILLSLKEVDPPGNYLRKIRTFYESYEKELKIRPLLGEVDSLSRSLGHYDPSNSKATATFAVRWNSMVQAFENLCLETVSRQRIGDLQQLLETLQNAIYEMQEQANLPGWPELISQTQNELSKLYELKKYPKNALAKFNLAQQYTTTFQTEKPPVHKLLTEDSEIQSQIAQMNKCFLRLVNSINQKLPAPQRNLKIKPSEEDFSPAQDYRLVVSYHYNGNDDEEFDTNCYAMLRNMIR